MVSDLHLELYRDHGRALLERELAWGGTPMSVPQLPYPMPPRRPVTLSKSRFCYGLQCLKQLWWRVHEPKAPELQAGPALQAVFDRGHLVGERAQGEFPGGTLIGHEYWEVEKKVADTRAAIAARAPAVYEASFVEETSSSART